MEKHNKISNKMYEHFVEQKVQQNVHNNYVAVLIKNDLFLEVSVIPLLIPWILS